MSPFTAWFQAEFSRFLQNFLSIVYTPFIKWLYNVEYQTGQKGASRSMHRLQRFFIGRNGADELARTNSVLACVLLILSMFIHGIASTILWVLALVFLLIAYYRMFSRDLVRQQEENHNGYHTCDK